MSRSCRSGTCNFVCSYKCLLLKFSMECVGHMGKLKWKWEQEHESSSCLSWRGCFQSQCIPNWLLLIVMWISLSTLLGLFLCSAAEAVGNQYCFIRITSPWKSFSASHQAWYSFLLPNHPQINTKISSDLFLHYSTWFTCIILFASGNPQGEW